MTRRTKLGFTFKAPKDRTTAEMKMCELIAEAGQVMGALNGALAATTKIENPNWGDVGSLAEAVRNLKQAGNYLGIALYSEE